MLKRARAIAVEIPTNEDIVQEYQINVRSDTKPKGLPFFMIKANRRSYTLIDSLSLWKAPGAQDNLRVLLAGGKDLSRKRNAINQPERL